MKRLLLPLLLLLLLVSLVSACGTPTLAYHFIDNDHRAYRLNMTVAEKGPDGETLGTVTLDALLRTGTSIDERYPCACFVTVDYVGANISTSGLAQGSGNQIPRAYFPLCRDRSVTLTGPARRGDGSSFDLARTGPNGSLTAMLLNTFVGKCLAKPLRDSAHELKVGDEWTTIRQFPCELMACLYTGKRPTGDQNRETTRVKVTGLTARGALADLAWSSVTPLGGSRKVALTEDLLGSGMNPSEMADRAPAKGEPTVTISASGWSDCSGTALVRTSDGWPQRSSVDMMTIHLTHHWSDFPGELAPSEEMAPVEVILEMTGSIEALP